MNLNSNFNKTTKNLIVTTQMRCTLGSVLPSRNIFSMKCWGKTVHENVMKVRSNQYEKEEETKLRFKSLFQLTKVA